MRVRVRVPATSANLGPGFDSMGLAVAWYDEIEVTPSDRLEFDLSGEGAADVPRDETHLVLRSLRDGLRAFGHPDPDMALRLSARSTIPHARGLGSSAAAIGAGLGLAWGLTHPDEPIDRQRVFELGSLAEGHPDNAGAVVFGGAVVAWLDPDDVGAAALEVHPDVRARVWVPSVELPTVTARAVLPSALPRPEVIAQASTAALLVHALARQPELLWRATMDWLHQDLRGPLMPTSHDLLRRLRHAGVAAVISGAGPTVLALGTPEQLAVSDRVEATGFVAHTLPLGHGLELEIDHG
ncbi:homoserine kinase [Aestuariimicrobium ganziense]|uniref:homoserine kinase n=1 Tax=Aestuariimicrobium ganziense TaxID=2773677 RepID=UPI001941F51B|nr:homoserine kinase [Aestuariimicrobium ganziense]